jgi:hypothetical protein
MYLCALSAQVAEARWSWLTLALLTLSAAMKEYTTYGSVSLNMAILVFAHWLYSNATAKGEHCIPATWDMFHEQVLCAPSSLGSRGAVGNPLPLIPALRAHCSLDGCSASGMWRACPLCTASNPSTS